MQTAVNPTTGETVVLIEGQWKPVAQVATNPKGQKAFLIGDKWIQDDAPVVNKMDTPPERVQGGQQPIKLNKFDEFLGGLPNIQSSVPGRMIRGAADLPVGAMQLGLNVLGQGDKVNPKLEETFRQSRPEGGGFDWARLGGNLLNPVTYMGAGMMKDLPTVGKAILGGDIGLLMGLSAPVDKAENYKDQKIDQSAAGAMIGGAIPPVMEAGKAVFGPIVRGVGQTANLFLPGGADRIKNAYWRRLVGEDRIPEVQDALRSDNTLVAGSRPTAGEVLANVPGGSPIHAQQQAVAAAPGGISAMFADRLLEQDRARHVATVARDRLTGALRDSALKRANMGGVRVNDLVAGMGRVLHDPEMSVNDVARKAISETVNRLQRAVRPDGTIDARALYAIKQTIDEPIERLIKQGGSLKGKAVGLRMDMEKVIDAAIEDAEIRAIQGAQGARSGASAAAAAAETPAGGVTGMPARRGTNVGAAIPESQQGQLPPGQTMLPGRNLPDVRRVGDAPLEGEFTSASRRAAEVAEQPEWREYLREFSKRTADIEADAARSGVKPVQKTVIPGGLDIAQKSRLPIPNVLDRPITYANAITRMLASASGIEPKIERGMAQDLLNPRQLAEALEQTPLAKRGDVARILFERALLQGNLNQGNLNP